MDRVYNFSPGPSMLPLPVLERAAKEMTNYGQTGMSVMEMSHRSRMYLDIYQQTEANLRSLMNIPPEYAVLFLHGGATEQFAAVPLNLGGKGQADYIESGNFAKLAAAEAARYIHVTTVASSRADTYSYIPDWEGKLNPEAAYLHITTNNTIYGTRYAELPDSGAVPLVADMSSNILSEVYDVNRFGAIYAGAQKNIGPAGLAVLIVKRDLLGNPDARCPKLMNWTLQAENESMINTPNTYGIYLAGLCFEWLLAQGGVPAMEKINIEKANLVYDYIDESKLFSSPAAKAFRSRMNITFVTGDAALDDAFVKEAAKIGLVNLKGHRSVGGMRASIYNAMPVEGVKALVSFMKAFESAHA
ncbi:MAG: 3-phosphoserine/phosphohydroxythreonine transaminase [Oscillospiraceae bacterium]|nr:3-phosphoserine/phosphohydroxythreonine transaminase [Oscillospiraceae bacterium]